MKQLESLRASTSRKILTAVLAAQMVILNVSPAWAAGPLPVPVDSTDITTDGTTMKVGSSRVGASIDWSSFDIDYGYTLRFIDQAGDTTVNKIGGGAPSSILGAMLANGKIYLLNPDGIIFGSTATVNVGGLVASTMTDVEKTAEGWTFGDPGSGDITVESGASINAGAFAYLVGRNVSVAGTVNAGDTVFAAYGGASENTLTLASSAGGTITLNLGDGWTAGEGDGSVEITGNLSTGGADAYDDGETQLEAVDSSSVSLYASQAINQAGESTWESKAPEVSLTAEGTGGIALGSALNTFEGTVSAVAESGAITLNAANDLVLGTVSAGDLLTVGAGSLSQAENQTIAANGATLTASSGNIVLDNAGNKFDGSVSAAADSGSIALKTTDGLALGAVSANDALTLVAESITQASDADKAIVVKDAALSATGGSITLDNAANDFSGTVTAVATNGSIVLNDVNALTLGGMTAKDGASATAGEALAVAGAVKGNGTVVLSGTSVTLDAPVESTSDSVTILSTGDVTSTANGTITAGKDVAIGGKGTVVSNVNPETGETSDMYVLPETQAKTISLAGDVTAAEDIWAFGESIQLDGDVDAGNLLYLDASAGNIAQGTNGVLKTGGKSVLVASGDITLGNEGNDFGGAVSADGGAVTLTDANGIELGVVNASSLTVEAKGGDITQSGAATVTGESGLTATGDITLGNEDNDFGGAVSADGGAVTLTDANDILLGEVESLGNVIVTAGGTFTNTAAVTAGQTVNLASGGNMDVKGAVTAGNDVTATAGGSFTNTAAVTATDGIVAIQAATDATLAAAVEAGRAEGATEESQAGLVSVTATEGVLTVTDAGSVDAATDAELASGGNMDVNGTVTAGNDVTATAGGTFTNTAAVTAGQTVNLASGGNMDVKGAVTAGNDVTATAGGSFTNTAAVTATDGIVAIQAATDATLAAAVEADRAEGATEESQAGLVSVTATEGVLTVTDAGSVDTATDAELASGGNMDVNGTVTAGNDVTATAGGSFTNTAAVTATDGIVAIQAATDATLAAAVEAGRAEGATEESQAGLVSVTATEGVLTVTDAGSVDAATDAELASGGNMDVNGTVTAGNDVTATAEGSFTNTAAGTILAVGADAQLASGGNMTLAGTVTAGHDINADAGAKMDVNAAVDAGHDVDLTSGRDMTLAATVTAENNITADAGRSVQNTAEVKAGNNAFLHAQEGTATIDADVKAGQHLTVESKDDARVNADLQAGEDLVVKSTAGSVRLADGITVKADDDLVMKAGQDLMLTTAAITGKNVGLEAGKGDLFDDSATLKASNAMVLKAKGSVTLKGGIDSSNIGMVSDGDIVLENLEADRFAATSTGGSVIITTTSALELANLSGATGKITADRADGGQESVDGSAGSRGLNGIQAGRDAILDVQDVSGSQIDAHGTADITAAAYSVRNTSAGGNVDLDAASVNSITITSGGGDVNANVAGSMNVETLEAGHDIVLDSVGGDFAATTVSARNDANLDIRGNATVQDLSAGNQVNARIGGSAEVQETRAGKLTADIGGSATLKKANIGGSADIKTGGSLTFDQMQAGNVKIQSGTLNAGKLTADRADIDASSVHDNGSLLNTGTLNLRAGGDIGSEGRPINLETRSSIEHVSGNNVYLVELASGHDVVVGEIHANGHLTLSAPRIGLPDGAYGFRDGNGNAVNLYAGNGLDLDVAGFFGQPDDEMEAVVRGPWTLRSGTLHGMSNGDPSTGTPLSMIYMIFENTDYSYSPVYMGDGPIPGLVIVNGRAVQGHPDLLRKIHSALAFTADTPELKSEQGVFGNPFFLHSNIALTDMAALGLVDYLKFGLIDLPSTTALRNASVSNPSDPEETIGLLRLWGLHSQFNRPAKQRWEDQPTILPFNVGRTNAPSEKSFAPKSAPTPKVGLKSKAPEAAAEGKGK